MIIREEETAFKRKITRMCLFKCPHLASAVQLLLRFCCINNVKPSEIAFPFYDLLPNIYFLSDNEFGILVNPKPANNISLHQTSLAVFDYTAGLYKVYFLRCHWSFMMSICAPCIIKKEPKKELNHIVCADMSSHKRFTVRNSL